MVIQHYKFVSNSEFTYDYKADNLILILWAFTAAHVQQHI